MGKPTPKPTVADDSRHTRPVRGPEARAEAARLLAEGLSCAEVARRVGVTRQTVSEWKHGTAAPEVAQATEKRAQSFEDAAGAARAELRDGLHGAALKLVELTKHPDPAVALRATTALMDRAGLPRVEVVATEAAPLDLSGLTEEELELFERVMQKATGR